MMRICDRHSVDTRRATSGAHALPLDSDYFMDDTRNSPRFTDSGTQGHRPCDLESLWLWHLFKNSPTWSYV